MTPEQIAGGFALVGSTRPAERVERSVLAQLDALPAPARLLLLLAAADPTGNPTLLWRASELLSLGPETLNTVLATGELSIGARVRFRNPLMRSAVYSAGSQEDRRRVHAALARATGEGHDSDRRAWHRSRATVEHDEGVAEALERSAAQARTRGGVAAAAAFLERAAALTRDPVRRGRRVLAAAQAKYDAGAPEAALLLLDGPETSALASADQARADRLRALAGYGLDRDRDAPSRLVAAARDLAPFDVRLARATYLEALEVSLLIGDSPEERSRIGRAMLEALAGDDSDATDAMVMRGVALLVTDDREAAVPVLRRALTSLVQQPADVSLLGIAGRVAAEVWDADAFRILSDRHVELARADGVLACLPDALNRAAFARVLDGRLDTAEALADEVDVIIEATGHLLPRFGRFQVAAWRGDEQQVRRRAAELRRISESRAVSMIAYGQAVLNNGLGRYADVMATGRQDRPHGLDITIWLLPEIIEAAARTGDRGLAEQALAELTTATRSIDDDWAHATLAAVRAHVDDDGAEALYREAIAGFQRGRMALLEGRAHLCFGEWLRRRHRRIDAREQLHEAHALLSRGGATAFAERARRELAATGEIAHRRSIGAHEPLMVQERNVATMACDGLTNREIGTRLFISARTVEYHLRKVFLKLDVSSRRQLAVALRGSR